MIALARTTLCVTAAAAALLASPVRASAAERVLANTEYVEDIAVDGDTLYAATRGGVEVYSLSKQKRLAHYTHLEGLGDLHVRAVEVTNGQLVARLAKSRCELRSNRFHCLTAQPFAGPGMTVAGRQGGARITKKIQHGSFSIVATAGAGIWLRGKRDARLTPTRQICSNHLMAIAEFRGRTYFGSFDQGLCSTDDNHSFVTHAGPFRMINDLEVTPKGMYIAAAEGLFVTNDGHTFKRVPFVKQRGVNGLAFDGRSLYITTPGALWRLRINGGPRTKQWWRPGGSRSLQAVAASGRHIWIATEDRGLIRKTLHDFEVHDRASGLASSWMLDVTVAPDGTAYGASLRDGIVKVRSGKAHKVSGSPDPWTLFVALDRGRLWVGAQGGATAIRKGKRAANYRLPNPNVHTIAPIGDRVYVATEGGTLLASRQ